VIDIQGVGEELHTIPIKAECTVSEVTLPVDTVDFGECFLRHSYIRTLDFQNESELSAKFEMQSQDEASKAVATISPDRPMAAINPKSSHSTALSLTPYRLGRINMPICFKVPGSGSQPMVCTILADVVGPRVATDHSSLDWGKVMVLQDEQMVLKLKNESPIPAEFKAFIHKKESVFTVDPPTGRMKPFETVELTVTAHLNEVLKMTDTLHILIHEGDDITSESQSERYRILHRPRR